MPLSMDMGAKAWVAPGVKAPVSSRSHKNEEMKQKKEEAAIAKLLDKEASKLVRKTIVESGRLIAEEQKDEYLARLKADVAKLEAKQNGATGSKPAPIASTHVEDSVGGYKLSQLAAARSLAKREAQFEEKRKKHEHALAEEAEQRRKELLDYKLALGLPHDENKASAHPKQAHRAAPLTLYDDPKFWALDPSNRQRLELMHPDERVNHGYGPYRDDLLSYGVPGPVGKAGKPAPSTPYAQGLALTIKQKLRAFQCTEAASLPHVVQVFDPIDNARAVQLPDLATLGDSELPAAQAIIDEAAHALEDELVLFAIEHFGANALLSFTVDGPLPVDDQQLIAQGYLYELVASGIPAIVRKTALAPALAPQPKNALKPPTGPYAKAAKTHVGFADSPLFGQLPASPLLPPTAGVPPKFLSFHVPSTPHALHQGFPYSHPHHQQQKPSLTAPGPSIQPAGIYASQPQQFYPSATAGLQPLPGISPVPPEVASMPWGAQMYVKRVRAMQEQEEQEARARALGAAAQTTTVDPHHGGDEAVHVPPSAGDAYVGLGFGAGQAGTSAFPAAAAGVGAVAQGPLPPLPKVAPSKENGWRGNQPW
ncbi:hypothetical protein JCM10908_006235 [Rhodotorula pacifica]|uniref:uncharacterized protein n=1 Tax=Rhodotorula pacifica TaxID=1495444 RepID=UPI003179EEE5